MGDDKYYTLAEGKRPFNLGLGFQSDYTQVALLQATEPLF
jgi:hypothetical protein